MVDKSNCTGLVPCNKMGRVPLFLFHEVMSQRRCERLAKDGRIVPGQITPRKIRNRSTTQKVCFLHPITHCDRRLVI